MSVTSTRLSRLMVPVMSILFQQRVKDPHYKNDILMSMVDGELCKLEDAMQVSLDDIAVNWAHYLVEGR